MFNELVDFLCWVVSWLFPGGDLWIRRVLVNFHLFWKLTSNEMIDTVDGFEMDW